MSLTDCPLGDACPRFAELFQVQGEESCRVGSPHLEKQAPAHGLAGEESANMKHSPRLVPSSLHLSCLLSGGATSLLDLPSPILTEFDFALIPG